MLKPDRLSMFSDAVMAIAITLLILGLEVPSVHKLPDQQLPSYLLQTLHPFMGYVGSFVLIGTYWLQHYAVFHFITRANRTLVALNGLFLLSVSFVPFPTGMQAVYRDDELAMVLYAGTQIVCGLSLLALWTYASSHHRLIATGTSSQVIKSMSRRIAITPAIGVAAMVVSFFSMTLSRLMFLAIPFVYLSHHAVDNGWEQSQHR